MGSKGGEAPNPWQQHRAVTLFLRVPMEDWTKVKIGVKTEFRTLYRPDLKTAEVDCPTPVVAYTASQTRGHNGQLMVLEDRRVEPVFAISDDDEAVRREGFETYDEFRRYWRKRRAGIYRPMERVHVWRVHPWRGAEDEQAMGFALLKAVYGDFLPPFAAPPSSAPDGVPVLSQSIFNLETDS